MPLTRIDSAFLDLDAIGGIDFDVQSGIPTLSVDATTHRVGIGQANPQSKLQIENDGEQLRLTYPSIASYIHEVKSNGDYAIDKDGTEKVRITSGGNVLVGNITTGSLNGIQPALQVDRPSSSVLNASILIRENEASTSWPKLYLSKNRSDNPVGPDNKLGSIDFYGDNGSNDELGARIEATADGTGFWSAASRPTRMVFSVTPSGSTTLTEVMRLDPNGNVGIGTNNPSYPLQVWGSGTRYISVVSTDSNPGILFGTSTTPTASYITYSPTDSRLNFGVSGTHMVVESSGNVGIGTDNPTTKLEVYGVDASSTVHYSGQCRGGISALSAQRLVLSTTADADDILFGYGSSPVTSANFVPRMKIDNGTGNVGIGTDNPLSKLHLSNAGAEGLEIYIANSTNVNAIQHYNRSSSVYVTHRNIALDHKFETSGIERLRITSGGVVQINGDVQDAANDIDASNTKLTIKQSAMGLEDGIYIERPSERRGHYIRVATSGNAQDALVFGMTHFGTETDHLLALDRTGNVTMTAGSVGIGTDSPGQTLDVRGAGIFKESSSPTLYLDADTSDWPALMFQGTPSGGSAGTQMGSIGFGGSTSNELEIWSYGSIKLNVSGSGYGNADLAIGANGNVGINTTSPSHKLVVINSSTTDNESLFTTQEKSGSNAAGYSASGLQIHGAAKTSSGNDHTTYINMSTRAPSLNGSHGCGSFITLTSPNSQGTYGTGQLDFYIRNSAPYSFPNDPSVSSTYWMSSLFTIKSDGNVGVGTTDPQDPLHIERAGDFKLKLHSTGNSNVGLRLWSTKNWIIQSGPAAGDGLRFYDETSGGLGEVLRLDNNGNVGIGTDNPGRKLHIYSSNPLRLSDQNRTWDVNIKDGKLVIGDDTAAADRFTIDTSGNVGVGTTDPTQKLHVYSGGVHFRIDGNDFSTYQYNALSINSINATDNDTNCWNRAGNYGLKLVNHNNALAFTVGGSLNQRVSMIQGGHSSTAYAQYLSELRLNPLGGLVKVGSSGLAVVGAGLYSRPFNVDSENANTEFKAVNTTNGYICRDNGGWSNFNDNSSTCGCEVVLFNSALDGEWQPFSVMAYVTSCATNGGSTASAWYYYRCRVYGNETTGGFSITLVDSGGDTGSFTISFIDDGAVGTTYSMGNNSEARQFELRLTGPGARTAGTIFVTSYSGVARFRRQP